VAWTVTNGEADYQDVYVEKFKKGKPNKYLFRKTWKTAQVSREVIKVRGRRSIALDVTITHHGPIIAGDPAKGYGLAFKSTANSAADRGSQCFLTMLKGGSYCNVYTIVADLKAFHVYLPEARTFKPALDLSV
jgi:penicillin amidase